MNNKYNFNSVKRRLNIDDSLIIKWAGCHNMPDPVHTDWTEKQVTGICDFFSHYRSGINMDAPMFDTRTVQQFLHTTSGKMKQTLYHSPEFKPLSKDGCAFRWSVWEINRLNVKITGEDIDLADIGSALDNYTVSGTPYVKSNVILDNVDALLDVHDKVRREPNLYDYLTIKSRFEQYSEKDLSIIFSEVLRRFKFAYIVENVHGCQTQTLTAIKQGTLGGLDRFKMSFDVYLRLIKFAKEHNCPLKQIQK